MASTMSLDEETAKKVIRQVEFYFGDSNLPRDAFLTKTINKSEDGMVSLALISSFSRMRSHLGLGDVIPEDVSEDTVKAVAETLRTSTFLKVSADGKKVGRVIELPKPEEAIKQSDDRTIAASPLAYDVKLEDVESFFGQYTKVNSVRLPRHVVDNRLFCGTALIEFSSEDEANKLLTENLSYSGVNLELKPKKDFDAEQTKKQEEIAKTRPQVGPNHKDKANAEPEYPKGLIVKFKLKKISGEVVSEQNGSTNSVSDNTDAIKNEGEENKMQVNVEKPEKGNLEDATEMDRVEDTGISEEKETDMTVSEAIAQETEDTVKSPETVNENEDQGSNQQKRNITAHKDNKDVVLREDLKCIFQKFGTVKYIDFKMGSDSGYIRFEDAGAAQKARAAAALTEEGGLTVKTFIAILDTLTGEAEKEYWSLIRNKQEKHGDNFKSNRGRGGRHNRGGKRFGGKHSRSRENDSHPNKAQKVGAA